MSTLAPTPPPAVAPEVDWDRLESRYEQALDAGAPGDLAVVGYGEISLAFAWPPEDPQVAVRSLPVFTDGGRLRAYADLVDEYVATLRDRGVDVLPTSAHAVPAPGGWRGWLAQPLLPAATIGPEVLRRGGADAVRLLEAVLDHLVTVVDDRVGLDAQVSNWALVGGRLRYLDVGTPMLRDHDGRDRLDVAILATAVPWLVRGLVVRVVAPGLLAPYHDPRRTVLDTAGNLLRERLPWWVPPLLDLAAPHLERPVTVAEVRRFYRGNAATYASLQAMRRLDRAWSRRVRRRPYPFLLPDHYDR